jgi:large subunit ribosomal protein L15
MPINKRSKFSRRRGSHTHGWGSMKKRRGAGNRGGRGMAGTGKRGDAKKPMIWKDTKYFGKYGFKKKNIIHKVKPVNLAYFEEKLEKLLAKKLIEQKGDSYVIDVKKLGFNKVLGYGKPTKKFQITSPSFSKDAIEKIKAAGGEAVELKKKLPKKAPAEKAASEAKPEEPEQ